MREKSENMNFKPIDNLQVYLKTLQKLTPEQKLLKTFELSDFSKKLFLSGLHKRFPNKTDEEIMKIYRERLELCHNRNY
ncbi:MAG: hypothetical protein ACD_79C01180G0001 [uncultured bacterium]|nr:MAG: hypothetical protein ACD_79C01180G0001 [uncultured bacterium]